MTLGRTPASPTTLLRPRLPLAALNSPRFSIKAGGLSPNPQKNEFQISLRMHVHKQINKFLLRIRESRTPDRVCGDEGDEGWSQAGWARPRGGVRIKEPPAQCRSVAATRSTRAGCGEGRQSRTGRPARRARGRAPPEREAGGGGWGRRPLAGEFTVKTLPWHLVSFLVGYPRKESNRSCNSLNHE